MFILRYKKCIIRRIKVHYASIKIQVQFVFNQNSQCYNQSIQIINFKLPVNSQLVRIKLLRVNVPPNHLLTNQLRIPVRKEALIKLYFRNREYRIIIMMDGFTHLEDIQNLNHFFLTEKILLIIKTQ